MSTPTLEALAPERFAVDAGPDTHETAKPVTKIAEAIAPLAGRTPIALSATHELLALTGRFSASLKTTELGFEMRRADLAGLRAEAADIPDRVQRDLVISALDKIGAQGGAGKNVFLNETRAKMLGTDLASGYGERTRAILEHPALSKTTNDAVAELFVRYANDPVFLATVHGHIMKSGGITNAHQMFVGDAHSLHAIDEYFGQCNETQGRTEEIFEQLTKSRPDHGIEGFKVSERSRVLLAYGLMGDGPGDSHFLYGIEADGVGSLYLDPWLHQRADAASVMDPATYQETRDGLDSSHWYEEHRVSPGR